MNHKLLLLLLAFFSGNALSFQPTIEIIEQFDDTRLVAFINTSDIENYPLWHPLNEAPPLSINDAIQAIQNLHATNNNSLFSETVEEIEIREISRHKNFWHYLVKMKTDNNKKSKHQIYVVLMNGKVIPALIEPESYK